MTLIHQEFNVRTQILETAFCFMSVLNEPLSGSFCDSAIRPPLFPSLAAVQFEIGTEANAGQASSRRYSTCPSSLKSLYSTASAKAIQLASMMFSLTPTVLQTESSSAHSITTRTLAAVPSAELMTRTL